MENIILLWIDDMENWAASAQSNLILIGTLNNITINIIPARNGEDILQQCMMYNFDGIIMDYNMEPFNGDKYIKDIRFEEHLEHIPIIFYSQDNNVDLDKLVVGLQNIETVFRGNLEDKIKELFF
jgi:PleD family two-component response regulator